MVEWFASVGGVYGKKGVRRDRPHCVICRQGFEATKAKYAPIGTVMRHSEGLAAATSAEERRERVLITVGYTNRTVKQRTDEEIRPTGWEGTCVRRLAHVGEGEVRDWERVLIWALKVKAVVRGLRSAHTMLPVLIHRHAVHTPTPPRAPRGPTTRRASAEPPASNVDVEAD